MKKIKKTRKLSELFCNKKVAVTKQFLRICSETTESRMLCVLSYELIPLINNILITKLITLFYICYVTQFYISYETLFYIC